ncbi:MAG TPA: dihydroorotase [Actinomycetota bacterium]|nr:dihydroorotase [Actinomycetota bacterium]
MAGILFKGGRLIDPASGVDSTSDVLVDNGRVVDAGSRLSANGAEVIDITGAVICPGFVDLHVHLREPGREDEETVATGSAAAARGGFTAVGAMPNTDPVCDNAAVADKVAAAARRAGLCEVIPAGALTRGLEGRYITPVGEMVNCSAGVRMFTDDGKGVQDSRILRRAMEYIKGFDAICAEHCDDAALSEGGQMHEGYYSDLLGLRGMPAAAEDIALARDLVLARLTGVRYHALHVSTKGSVELIRQAKAQGVRVTAEVTPHHLILTDAELQSFDPVNKVNPPLRSSADVEACRVGLADGTLDAVATDHAPHSPEEKESEFELAPPGMIGLETALALMIAEIVDGGVLELPELVRRLTALPAGILRLNGQGGPVTEGSAANLTVFDPAAEWTVDPAAFASKSRNTPFKGRKVKGKILYTMFGGNLVVRNGAIAPEYEAVLAAGTTMGGGAQ